jgi:hypothetical protein
MKKKLLISIIFGMTISIILLVFQFSNSEKLELDSLSISYTETNKKIQTQLSPHNISMSSPLKLNGFSIEKYCTFFSDAQVQNSIEYCTSTELLDSKGGYLGNIHMVGITNSPKYVIGVTQMDPIGSQLDEIKIIYKTIIESTVCSCWEEIKPGDFDTVSDWIEAANNHHLDAKKTTSKSEINGLAQKDLLLEITTNSEGYLWKFIVPN